MVKKAWRVDSGEADDIDIDPEVERIERVKEGVAVL